MSDNDIEHINELKGAARMSFILAALVGTAFLSSFIFDVGIDIYGGAGKPDLLRYVIEYRWFFAANTLVLFVIAWLFGRKAKSLEKRE